jgi:hypothetical protein
VLVGVSLATPPDPEEQLRDLTFQTVSAEGERAARRPLTIGLTLLLVACVLVVWLYFSPLVQG